MLVFFQTVIFTISIFGIFLFFHILTDDIYVDMKKEDRKIIDIYTNNLDKKSVELIIKEIEKSKELGKLVDTVNIHEKFDKRK